MGCKIFHVTTSDGEVYGVAAIGKTEARVLVQARLTDEGSQATPTITTYVGTDTSGQWRLGNVLHY